METWQRLPRRRAPPGRSLPRWQTPAVIIISGCLIAMLSFGPRSALGQFLMPMSVDQHWDRNVFSLALAIQNILWGAGQPFAGALADKFGAVRVLSAGAILYALGLWLMATRRPRRCWTSAPAC